MSGLILYELSGCPYCAKVKNTLASGNCLLLPASYGSQTEFGMT